MIRKVDEFINNTYINKINESVIVVGGERYGGYLWLKCVCCQCNQPMDSPIRHTNLENGKFVCHHCHPDRELSFFNIENSQLFRFNIMQKNNTSGYVGVDYVKKQKKWRARLNYNKQCYDLGRFDTAEEAHQAREAKRKELGLININRFTDKEK